MKNHKRMIKSYFAFAILLIFVIITIIIIFDNYKTNKRAVDQTYREFRLISFLILTIYVKDSNLIIGEENELVDSEVVFNAFLRMNMLSDIEYIIGPSRISESKKMGLLLDPWENPYVITLSKLDESILINMRSNGPDQISGTSDDILFRRTY